MKWIFALLLVCVMGCAVDEPKLSETEQGICTEGCSSYINEVWHACVEIGCGGGVGGNPWQYGDTFAETCVPGGHVPCTTEFGHPGRRRYDFCCSSGGANISCTTRESPYCQVIPDGGCTPSNMGPPCTPPFPGPPVNPPPPPPTGPGGGGGSSEPPCHGSGCQSEQGQPTSNL